MRNALIAIAVVGAATIGVMTLTKQQSPSAPEFNQATEQGQPAKEVQASANSLLNQAQSAAKEGTGQLNQAAKQTAASAEQAAAEIKASAEKAATDIQATVTEQAEALKKEAQAAQQDLINAGTNLQSQAEETATTASETQRPAAY